MSTISLEDIVDMEWLNSNTTSDESLAESSLPMVKEEPLDPFATSDYTEPMFANQPLYWQQTMLDPTLNMNQSFDMGAQVNQTLSDNPTAAGSQDVKSELIMPTTEQIRQLIDIAKRHLALWENQPPSSQLPSLENTPPFDSVPVFGSPSDVSPPETIAPESLMKKEPEEPMTPARAESVSHEDIMTLEAYAESDGIDIKKLTPKERRQLRNKISARNFRVRRKEYITALEAKVDKHKKNAEELQMRLTKSEDENKQLRLEVDSLRRQNQALLQQQLQQQQNKATTVTTTDLVRSPSSSRVSSPIPKPNLNKDISMLGTKASDTYRNDTRILVSNAVMPVWDFNRIMHTPLTTAPTVKLDQSMKQLIGYALAHIAQAFVSCKTNDTMTSTQDKANEGEHWLAPLLPDERDFCQLSMEKPAMASGEDEYAVPDLESLYDTLIMSALIANVKTGSNVADRAFWWWDTPSPFNDV